MGTFPNKETQFSSTNQPVKNGRKKKIYTILKELGYSFDDIKTAFNELAFYKSKELEKLINDIEKPILIRIISNQYLMALEESDWGKIKEILEHVIGKPKQSIDHTTDGDKIEPPTFIFKKLNED